MAVLQNVPPGHVATPRRDRRTILLKCDNLGNRRSVIAGQARPARPGSRADFSNLPAFAKIGLKIGHNVAESRQKDMTGEKRMNGCSADRGRIRLYHRRRGLRRLRAGQPALGRSGKSRAAAGGGRARQLDLVSHSGRLSVRDRQSALGLDVPHRAGAGPQRPQPRLSARQGDRRLAPPSTR